MIIIAIILLLVKLMWNIFIPFVRYYRLKRWQKNSGNKPSIINYKPIIDVICITQLAVFTWQIGGKTKEVMMIATLLTIISYLFAWTFTYLMISIERRKINKNEELL